MRRAKKMRQHVEKREGICRTKKLVVLGRGDESATRQTLARSARGAAAEAAAVIGASESPRRRSCSNCSCDRRRPSPSGWSTHRSIAGTARRRTRPRAGRAASARRSAVPPSPPGWPRAADHRRLKQTAQRPRRDEEVSIMPSGTLTVMPFLDCASRRKNRVCRQPVHGLRFLHRSWCVSLHLNAYIYLRAAHPRTARALIHAQWMVVAGALSVDGEATSTFLCAAPPRPRARPSAPSLRPSRRPSAGLQEPRGRQQRARSRSPTRARSVHMCVRRDPSPLRRMPAPRPKRHPLSRRRCGGERRREGTGSPTASAAWRAR